MIGRWRNGARAEGVLGPVAIFLGIILCAFAVPAALRTPAPPKAASGTTTVALTPSPDSASPGGATSPSAEASPETSGTPSASASASPISSAATGSVTVVGLGDAAVDGWYSVFCASQPDRLRACSRVGGADTGSATLSKTYTDGLPSAPDLIVLADGNADIAAGVGHLTTIANLTVVLAGLHKRGLPVALATVLPDNAHATEVAALNRSLRALARSSKVSLLDLAAAVGTQEGRWTPDLTDDGRTPNAAGTSRLVDAVAGQLPTATPASR